MGKNGLLKAMRKRFRLCESYSTNINILNFDGHNLHWDADAMDNIYKKIFNTFFLKTGNSTIE